MFFYGFKKIMRTGGGKPASVSRSAHRVKHGADEALVGAHQNADNPFHDGSEEGRGFVTGLSNSRRSRFIVLFQSFWSWAKVASTDLQRSTQTTWYPLARGSPWARMISRMRRLSKLRPTARADVFLVQMIPNFEHSSRSASLAALITRSRPAVDVPSLLTRPN